MKRIILMISLLIFMPKNLYGMKLIGFLDGNPIGEVWTEEKAEQCRLEIALIRRRVEEQLTLIDERFTPKEDEIIYHAVFYNSYSGYEPHERVVVFKDNRPKDRVRD